jgi:DNA-binding XRE family transcriptional regulator
VARVAELKKALEAGGVNKAKLAKEFGITRQTLYAYIERNAAIVPASA